jgi:Zn-dependent protease with chaperone function
MPFEFGLGASGGGCYPYCGNHVTILACFLAAGVVVYSLNWLALIPWRRTAGAHWTERARVLYPVRVAAKLNVVCIPANIVLASVLLFPGDKTFFCLAAVAGLVGTMLGTYSFDREVFPWMEFRDWLHEVAVTWVMRFLAASVYIVAIVWMPANFGWKAWGIGVGALMFHLWLNLGLALQLARLLRVVKPPTPRLEQIVSATARELGIPYRKVWVLEGSTSNALAFPTTKELVFSRRLLALHPDDEIAAICAHELGHLSESQATLIGRLVGSCTVIPVIFIWPAWETFEIAGVAAIFLAMILLMWFARRLSRRMEIKADQFAGENQGQAGSYARALERVYLANQIPAVLGGRGKTHPHLYDRMVAVGIVPDYPRPKPPAGVAWSSVVVWILTGILIGLLLSRR